MAKKKGFETSLKALEEAVSRLEEGDLELEESLKTFEQGVKSAAECRMALEKVELQVDLLLKQQDGRLTREPFDE
ncbi:exodeoxyribonuclease VII small subunit [Geopsychrobacter electrodiphilus]|uniref:exodeoxyribonuclease VII small subunit n=1 Tax=Geopsychrobacter electrodiphilus TaxID=225196 RepID=UPI000378128B|nr:exodeoxyribonuclease VII small subunit [Geopsychrobacter electrodiphilus]